MDDVELLRRYIEDGSEPAFTELVHRHLDLVYSAALRQLGGDSHRAQDVIQAVFADLAQKAASLRHHNALTGWLYTSTRFAAAKAIRAEQRREIREKKAYAMNDLISSPAVDASWSRLRPVLDEAMHELTARDREALLLRFFEKESFPVLGRKLGLGENAARMSVVRALEKLRGLLAKRGITSTGAALGLVLTEQAVIAAPAGLGQVVAGGALAGAIGGGMSASVAIGQFATSAKISFGVFGSIGALALGTGLYYVAQARASTNDFAAIEQQTALLKRRVNVLGDQLARTDRANAELNKTLEITTVAKGHAALVAAQPSPDTADAALRQAVAVDPQYARLQLQRYKSELGVKYAGLFRDLGLSPTQIEMFETLLLRKQDETIEAERLACVGGFDPKNDPATQLLLRQIDQHSFEALRGLIGEDGWLRFRDYERTAVARDVSGLLAAREFSTDSPLTAQQARQLTSLLAHHSASFNAGGAVTLESIDVVAAVGEAQALLTAGQFAALKSMQAQWIYTRALEQQSGAGAAR